MSTPISGLPDANDEDGVLPIVQSGQTRKLPRSSIAAPVPLTVPTITGSAVVGQVVSASNGTWVPWDGHGTQTYTYQWKRDGVAIPAATNQTYQLQSDDAGTDVTVTVTAADSFGRTSITSAAIQPVILATAWNPATTDTDLTLSNANRTVTGAGGANGSTYAVDGQSAGVYYMETTLGLMPSATQPDIGVCNASFDYSVPVGSDGFSFGWRSDGAIYRLGIAIASVANYTTPGDVLSMRVDLNARTITFWGNGTLIYTGALTGVLATGTVFPAIGKSGGGSGVGNVNTTNFGNAPWAYPLLAAGAAGWPDNTP